MTSTTPGPDHLAAATRRWALELTCRPSVTGTPDEASFGPWLCRRLATEPAFVGGDAWSWPVAEGDGRHVVALLLRGRGRRTLVLTGHYDTVTTEDYGDLRPVAIDPEALAPALLARLRQDATSPAARRALADLEGGAFWPGRGLLDMKAGLAAGLAVAEAWKADPSRDGNLLLLAVPDEEAQSAGARAAAPALRDIATRQVIDLVAAINLDAIADDGDGSRGRAVALGTVGKVLPTAFVVGLPTHAGFPQAGLNAAVLAAAIARRVEWATELADPAWAAATPPSLLSLRDGKLAYDVTTPATAFATFNVLFVGLGPAAILDRFDALCREALDGVLAELRGRAGAFRPGERAIDAFAGIPLLRCATLMDKARAADPAAVETLLRAAPPPGASVPEQALAVTERLWSLAGLTGPAVVTGFGSVPYLPTRLGEGPEARRLAGAVAGAVATASAATPSAPIATTEVFAGISDMSFLGEADESSLALVAANTPVWSRFGWPAQGGIAGLPIVNAGPWGRDYHTPLERLDVRYGFETLPRLLLDIVQRLLPAA